MKVDRTVGRRPLGEVREHVRTWWQRVAAQTQVVPRALPRLASLPRSWDRSGLSAEPIGDDPQSSPARARETVEAGMHVGHGCLTPAEPSRSLERGLSLGETVVALRAPLVRLAAVASGPGGRLRGADPPRRAPRARDSDSSPLAITLRTLHRLAEDSDAAGAGSDDPGPGAPHALVSLDAASESVARDRAARGSNGRGHDPQWRELIETQQELAAAWERLERRPSQWTV